MMEDHAAQNGPLSWRDVYRAVAESEARVIAAVGTLGVRLDVELRDHESRLRSIEEVGPPLVQHMRGKFDQHVVEEGTAIRDLQKAAIIADAKKMERGSIILSARTALLAFVSIVTSIIVATAGAVTLFGHAAGK